MMPDALMLFAAGLGTRMDPLTRTRPKALVTVAGRPLIAHALDQVRGAGITRIVVNTHAHADQMAAWLATEAPDAIVSHEPERLETGGGLRRAAPLLGRVAFTLNCDAVWRGPNPLVALAAGWDGGAMGGLLCLVPRARARGHRGHGDFFLGADGRLARRGAAASADYVYAGAQILDLSALAGCPDGAFSLNVVWDALMARGRLFGVVHPGGWTDVGRPECIALAEADAAS